MSETAWLRTPERWALQSDQGGVKDLPLARIQFASALLALVDAEQASADELRRAILQVVADQQADGSWPISAAATLGTPSGYGTTLATAVAHRLLLRSEDAAAVAARDRSGRWLRNVDVQSVFDAAAVLLGVGSDTDADAGRQRARALELLRQGQARDGGWGPFVTSQPEVFDTALAVLALSRQGTESGVVGELVAGGRRYLVEQQLPDGSWPETTRPSQQESYSQRVSTTAWALLALVETSGVR